MTISKRERNKVLKDANRLITCDMDGENWSAPSGCFAVNFDLYEGMPVRSYHVDLRNEGKPSLSRILERFDTTLYKLAHQREHIDDDDNRAYMYSGETVVEVDYNRFMFVYSMYKGAKAYISTEKYSPVRIMQNNKLVALVMPLAR